MLDEIDKKILYELISNARISYVELARKLNLSEAAIRKRVKKLKEIGAIRGFTININPRDSKLFTSLTGIDVYPEKLMDVIESIRNMKEIKEIMITSGDHDIMVRIISESIEELKSIHERISKIEGVRRVCPSIVLEIVK